MSIKKISNLFTESEISHLNKEIKKIQEMSIFKTYSDISGDLGRMNTFIPISNVSGSISNKVSEVANSINDKSYKLENILHVDYRNKYGKPDLPPHFDADTCDLIINFQLSSNTSWDLGLEMKTYGIEDNSALIFNANHYVHWRPHKIFNNDEYVKMVFFRFKNTEYQEDYHYLDKPQGDQFFKKFVDFRNSLIDNK
jgi:hypothetical protein